MRYLYQPGELEGSVKGATDPIWSLKVYSIERSVTKSNQPVLYYVHDGPKRGFVREELLVIPPNTELPPEKLRTVGRAENRRVRFFGEQGRRASIRHVQKVLIFHLNFSARLVSPEKMKTFKFKPRKSLTKIDANEWDLLIGVNNKDKKIRLWH